MKLTRPLPLVATALAASLALAACGGSAQNGANGANGSATTGSEGGQALTVTDAAGRTVSFDKAPERVVFGEQRQAYVSMVLDKENPTNKVVAWGSDMEKAAPDMYSRLVKARPAVKDIPRIGSVTSGDLSVESLLAHKPDVFVMTLDSMRAAQKNGLLDKIDQAGIKYVVTDLRVRPDTNTEVTVNLMGKVLGREKQAQEFMTYYHSVVDPVLAKGKDATNRPVTFMWRAPGVKACCSTWKGVNFGQMITQVGGTNYAESLLQGEEGDLTPEQVLAGQPQVVVATGGAWSAQPKDAKAKTSFLDIGYDTTETDAAASLKRLRNQPGFEHLKAFDTGRVHGVYHQFYDAPFNFVAYQAFAKWQQPELYKDVDPAKTWKDFSAKFMPFPAEGTVVASVR